MDMFRLTHLGYLIKRFYEAFTSCYFLDSLERKTCKQNPYFFQEMKKAIFGGNELRSPVMNQTRSEDRCIIFNGEHFYCLL